MLSTKKLDVWRHFYLMPNMVLEIKKKTFMWNNLQAADLLLKSQMENTDELPLSRANSSATAVFLLARIRTK